MRSGSQNNQLLLEPKQVAMELISIVNPSSSAVKHSITTIRKTSATADHSPFEKQDNHGNP